MTISRTHITLVIRYNSNNEPDTVSLIAPFPLNHTDALNAYVGDFCLNHDMALFIPSDFTGWMGSVGLHEYNCEDCQVTCLQQGINTDGSDTNESFCSDFCRRAVANESG